ncbi:hypothetical protein PR202_gb29610 [Eleusine coracana subsp. coracana]|uniref:Uncharacterized protein n=1 Tax=Eleusine coracana subsp. coracana TaxID=191504 RepID=A0AAV5G039_ELECO|nr:hypothetical protein PR202_gb29610 [Eleusine coracana subsp. coracana]
MRKTGMPVMGDGQERPSTRLMPWTSSDAHGWCIVRQGLENRPLLLLLSKRRMLPADRSDWGGIAAAAGDGWVVGEEDDSMRKELVWLQYLGLGK